MREIDRGPEILNRSGIGQDSHCFSIDTKRPLILGGIKINDNGGLDGNSDADVVIHSLCNALSSAIGGGSLSTWADEMCKNGITDSVEYLKVIFNKILEKDYFINNISIAIEAKRPKLECHREKMVERLSEILHIEPDQVGMIFTSGEELTEFGKGKGIQVFSIVNLAKK